MAQRGGRRPAKYRQIAADLRARIERGEWAVDAQMPTQPELAAQYGDVAPGTIDKALGVLRELGIAETVHGVGTFVRTPGESAEEMIRRLASTLDDALHRLDKVEERLSEAEQAIRQDRRRRSGRPERRRSARPVLRLREPPQAGP